MTDTGSLLPGGAGPAGTGSRCGNAGQRRTAAVFSSGIALGALCAALVTYFSVRPNSAYDPSPQEASAVCTRLCQQNRDFAVWPSCARACDSSRTATVRPGMLGSWIAFDDAIQHIGITTSNITRSRDFYVHVLGGVEVNTAGNSNVQDTSLYQLLMQSALVRGGVVESWAANISAGGPQSLDVRYVAFDQLVIELLDYRTAEGQLQRELARMGTSDSGADAGTGTDAWPKRSDSDVAPSVATNMHIAFHVRSSLNLDDFVPALEKAAKDAGYHEVFCDRTVPLKAGPDGHPDPSPLGNDRSHNAIHQTTGNFPGWSLAYCKGPDGEQLEFNTVSSTALSQMTQAHQVYFEGGNNPIW